MVYSVWSSTNQSTYRLNLKFWAPFNKKTLISCISIKEGKTPIKPKSKVSTVDICTHTPFQSIDPPPSYMLLIHTFNIRSFLLRFQYFSSFFILIIHVDHSIEICTIQSKSYLKRGIVPSTLCTPQYGLCPSISCELQSQH